MESMPAAAELDVKASHERGLVVLSVEYSPEFLISRESSMRLSQDFQAKYDEEAKKIPSTTAPDCLVEIKASTAGSSLVKGLFDLYKSVNARGGKVICVGYPKDYFNSLTSLGLPNLSGFKLAYNKDEALKQFGKAA
jgi:hypothetical protein